MSFTDGHVSSLYHHAANIEPCRGHITYLLDISIHHIMLQCTTYLENTLIDRVLVTEDSQCSDEYTMYPIGNAHDFLVVVVFLVFLWYYKSQIILTERDWGIILDVFCRLYIYITGSLSTVKSYSRSKNYYCTGIGIYLFYQTVAWLQGALLSLLYLLQLCSTNHSSLHIYFSEFEPSIAMRTFYLAGVFFNIPPSINDSRQRNSCHWLMAMWAPYVTIELIQKPIVVIWYICRTNRRTTVQSCPGKPYIYRTLSLIYWQCVSSGGMTSALLNI